MIRLLLVLFCLTATAAGWATEQVPLSEDKPFAETHVLLQVSDAETVHHDAVLDIANNLTRYYGGQDMVDIAIVAFGAGVPMLFADNTARAERISSLMAYGVRFYVCGTTLDTLERKRGKRPALLPGVQTVQTGVAFMIEQMKRGYLLVHP